MPKSASPETPAYRRVEQEIRKSILAGDLPYGSLLPSTRVLAQQFGTSIFTIQTALGPLERDGLLERKPGRGSFVRGRPHQLTSAGIYFCSDFLEGDAAMYRELYRELTREFAAERVRHKLWIDHRPRAEQTAPLPEIRDALDRGEIQGLIVGRSNPAANEWLQKTGLPLSMFGTAPMFSARVNFDWRLALRQALGELRRQGCRSVGVICPMPVWGTAETDHADEIVGFYKEFVDAAADLGLAIRQEWMRTPPTFVPSSEFELFGYRQFQELWRQPERPDGLLAYPDVLARGVVTAALQTGASVPRDLKLVLHRNEGVPFLCPFPSSSLVTNVRQIALTLIELVKRQLAGSTVHTAYLPLGLESSPGLH